MTYPALAAASLLMLLTPAAAGAPPAEGGFVGRMQVRGHIVIRVPRVVVTTSTTTVTMNAPTPPPSEWIERKSRKCIDMGDISGAMVTRTDSIDLLMANGNRMRAHLGNDCPALGYYAHLYVRPTRDGKLCVHRDAIRSRSGASCRVEGLRTLVPAR